MIRHSCKQGTIAASDIYKKLCLIHPIGITAVRDAEQSQRQDLYVLATGYSGQLRHKVPNMMRESDFHQVGDKPKSANSSAVLKRKEDSITSKQDYVSRGSSASKNDDKHESKNSEHRREESDRERESKRDNSTTPRGEKEKLKEDTRRKEKSPRERSHREERYLESVSPTLDHRSASDDFDRDIKRKKVESSGSGKVSKDSDERSPDKEKKKAAKARNDERKERKMSRKRDRAEEPVILEQKRRRDEQKGLVKMGSHQNGSQEDHHYEKYHKREKSPFKERSHEHQEVRDKHRRNETKIRR